MVHDYDLAMACPGHCAWPFPVAQDFELQARGSGNPGSPGFSATGHVQVMVMTLAPCGMSHEPAHIDSSNSSELY